MIFRGDFQSPSRGELPELIVPAVLFASDYAIRERATRNARTPFRTSV